METVVILVLIGIAVAAWLMRDRFRKRAMPGQLRAGQPLPVFEAEKENGETVSSTDLRGQPAVLLFVRGSWCPFCSRQVKNLTSHYKEINESGARLILVTPKPLETTRRVADMFEVDFEFWLDRSLAAADKLGIRAEAGVPQSHRGEYGDDTMWPTALVVDADGVIRHSELSRFIADRPNAEKLLSRVLAL